MANNRINSCQPGVRASLNALDRSYTKLALHAPWAMRMSFAPLGWCARYWPRLFLSLMKSAVSPPDRAALRNEQLAEGLRRSELEAFRQGSRGGAHEALICYRPWDFDITTVNVPTHIWQGDQDIFVSQEMARYIQRSIPGVDFHWVEGGGHLDVARWDDILAACATHA
jgi:pimeloyl-ACP methyl ester carboxylesterase